MPAPGSWEQEARNWIAWTRAPDHDLFPYYAHSFLEEIVPRPHGRTLEIGCGEGRVSRLLASTGHHITGVDASPALVRAAREIDSESRYLVADATALPFADQTFSTVVAHNSLQTMSALADMSRAVGEASRVLAPAGKFCVVVAHPMTDLGRVQDDGSLLTSGSYGESRRVDETVTKGGLSMTFRGWTYTLQEYVRAFEDAGLVIERLREPLLARVQVAQRPELEPWRHAPLFLFLRAVKNLGAFT